MFKKLNDNFNKVWVFLAIGALGLFLFSSLGANSGNRNEKEQKDSASYANCPLTLEEDQIKFEKTALNTNKSIGKIDFEKDTIKGLEKDAVPYIDKPRFISTSLASKCISKNEEIFVVKVGDSTKAYPKSILTWHEVVNDDVTQADGTIIPILISYSPLTNYVGVYSRSINEEYTFGLSGRVWQNIPLLYDDKTESLWSQFTGEALVGDLTGQKLEAFAVERMTFRELMDNANGVEILSFDTGFVRNYATNPYEVYEHSKELYYPLDLEDSRYEKKDIVLGIELDGIYKAYKVAEIDKDLSDEISSQQIKIIRNSDYSFAVVSVTKEESVPFYISYWYAWAVSYPDTVIYKNTD